MSNHFEEFFILLHALNKELGRFDHLCDLLSLLHDLLILSILSQHCYERRLILNAALMYNPHAHLLLTSLYALETLLEQLTLCQLSLSLPRYILSKHKATSLLQIYVEDQAIDDDHLGE